MVQAAYRSLAAMDRASCLHTPFAHLPVAHRPVAHRPVAHHLHTAHLPAAQTVPRDLWGFHARYSHSAHLSPAGLAVPAASRQVAADPTSEGFANAVAMVGLVAS